MMNPNNDRRIVTPPVRSPYHVPASEPHWFDRLSPDALLCVLAVAGTVVGIAAYWGLA